MMHNNYSSLVLHQQIHPHTLQTTTHSFPTTVLGNEHEGIETKKHADIFVNVLTVNFTKPQQAQCLHT